MKSKMLSNVFTLMMLTAVMSSCEKMTLSESAQSENGEKGNVVLRVTQFEHRPSMRRPVPRWAVYVHGFAFTSMVRMASA